MRNPFKTAEHTIKLKLSDPGENNYPKRLITEGAQHLNPVFFLENSYL
jgi:hypothetical protein